jgi:RNA polymerase sigma-70 factor (ECF subfamily)
VRHASCRQVMLVICTIHPSQKGNAVCSLSDSDKVLMEQLKAGDMTALEVIYKRYRDMVEAAIRRVIPNVSGSDVEELTHDIFVALIDATPNFDLSKRLKPWLYGIAVNKAAGDKRTGWVHRTLLNKHLLETEALGLYRVDSPSKQVEIRRDLIQAFRALSKEQHDVMVLHAVEGFTGEEIAGILNIKVKTVWTRLHRARKTLFVKMYSPKQGVRLKGDLQ